MAGHQWLHRHLCRARFVLLGRFEDEIFIYCGWKRDVSVGTRTNVRSWRIIGFSKQYSLMPFLPYASRDVDDFCTSNLPFASFMLPFRRVVVSRMLLPFARWCKATFSLCELRTASYDRLQLLPGAGEYNLSSRTSSFRAYDPKVYRERSS